MGHQRGDRMTARGDNKMAIDNRFRSPAGACVPSLAPTSLLD